MSAIAFNRTTSAIIGEALMNGQMDELSRVTNIGLDTLKRMKDGTITPSKNQLKKINGAALKHPA